MSKIAMTTALLLLLTAGPAGAQDFAGSLMECSACQMLLKMIEISSDGDTQDLVVDMTQQCSLLKANEDRRACIQFYSAYGPKFIRAIRDRRAHGESVQQMCTHMGYCSR
jgi:hypothetical protein